MIEKLWFERHPLRFVFWLLLWPLSQLYGAITARRRRAYRQGKKAVYRSSLPVIVVGNITAGGNGKTPMVIWLVEQLVKLGFKPGVVSRGYGAKSPQYPLSVGKQTSTQHCGDEPKLIFERTGVPVVVDPIRSNAVQELEALGVDVVVTDDGLQHYALDRAFEIVVVDGQRRFGNEALLPLGPLREPLSRLQDVDLIVTNGGGSQQPNEKVFILEPTLAVNLQSGKKMAVNELGTLAAFAGIGHPPRFFATLNQLGANLTREQGFADHKDFDKQQLVALGQGVDNVIMTEKDAVKCRHFAHDNWWYLPVSANFNDHDSEEILIKIRKVIESYGS
ncbi:tetraacyldisaccharide 4'-kinase [Vibrio methylphosphonaticus]|uniref:tetraacyldisaccharide 4'-kinase n=1 Tax=Vibrio methylphosphonaticus TaxID=2946866 RepID=UPI002029B99F|nr:tetraacyldisaccharide 4'-kinase [Vibrio methylphosphonaticus]MCL9774674.1 tetraacyldisaccharide 4'-kinase [Vibrio methylphosphonaticus]